MRTIGIAFLVPGFLAIAPWSASAAGRRALLFPPDANLPANAALAPEEDKGDKTEKKRKGKMTLGKETTYVTEPLDKDGYIDYAAALNKRLGEGVTPANNANVLLWKSFGPRPEGGTMPPDFYEWMGIQPPPERGDYFVELTRYLKDHPNLDPGKSTDELYDQLERVSQRPWTAQAYPHLAAWLKANEKPLALVVEATGRSHYFSPLTPAKSGKGSAGLIGALLPGVQKCRSLASALAARAMLRTGEGAEKEAWQDLLACHRLGRLVGRGGTLIEALVGVAIDTIAGKADLAFLERTKPKAKRIEACLRDLQKLPPLSPIAEKVDLTERFVLLDIIMLIDRHGIRYLEGLSGGQPKQVNPNAERVLEDIDWNPTLQSVNRWYDRLAAALREKDRAVREAKLDQFEKDLRALKGQVGGVGGLAKVLEGKEPAKALGKAMGDILVALLTPAVRKVQQAADRSQQVQDNLALAFALAWYQRDHGHYPQSLDALAPKYLERIPQDLFSGKALIYRPSENGYLLYSVGVNGKDDGGRGYDDDPPGDDLVVRMPLPELRRK
jgi:hypothetical protein